MAPDCPFRREGEIDEQGQVKAENEGKGGELDGKEKEVDYEQDSLWHDEPRQKSEGRQEK